MKKWLVMVPIFVMVSGCVSFFDGEGFGENLIVNDPSEFLDGVEGYHCYYFSGNFVECSYIYEYGKLLYEKNVIHIIITNCESFTEANQDITTHHVFSKEYFEQINTTLFPSSFGDDSVYYTFERRDNKFNSSLYYIYIKFRIRNIFVELWTVTPDDLPPSTNDFNTITHVAKEVEGAIYSKMRTSR